MSATEPKYCPISTLRGHRTLTITRKGGKVVTIPLAPRTARAIDPAVGERTGAPVFLAADGAAAGPARYSHRRRLRRRRREYARDIGWRNGWSWNEGKG
jgi:integrase